METVAFFKTLKNTLDQMTNEEAGILIKALFAENAGETADLSEASDRLAMVYPYISGETGRLNDEREKKSLGGKTTGRVKEDPQKSDATHNHNQDHNQSSPNGDEKREAPPKEKRARFVPPTIDEVEAFAAENCLVMDCQRYMDHYASNGWRVGGKAPMKDWRASVRNWARNETKYTPPNRGDPVQAAKQSKYADLDFERLLSRSAE